MVCSLAAPCHYLHQFTAILLTSLIFQFLDDTMSANGMATGTSQITVATPSARCACLLDSGGTIWLLWVYRDPVGIKIDSVGTSRRKWPAVSNNVVFLAWFHENDEMAFPNLYPIEWCMYHFASTHTNTWNTVSVLMFLGVHKIWSACRGIKTEPISLRVCTYQLYFNDWHYLPCSNLSMSTKTTLIDWYLLLISMLWHRQAIFKSKGDKLCSSAECRIWTRGPRH